jgi:hypothetical protein
MDWRNGRGQVAREEQDEPGQLAPAILSWFILLGGKLFAMGFGKKFSGSLACQA